MGWTDEVHSHQTQSLSDVPSKKFKYVAHKALSQHHRRRLSARALGTSESSNRSTLLPVIALTSSWLTAIFVWRRGKRTLHRTSFPPLSRIGDFFKSIFRKEQTSNNNKNDKWKRMEPSAMAARAAVERAKVREAATAVD